MPSSVPHTGPYDSDFDPGTYGADDPEDVFAYEPDSEERTLALMAHLSGYLGLVLPFGSLIGPAAIYYLKRDESAFVEDQAREALNFQLSIALGVLVAAFLSMIVIGIPILLALVAWWFIGTGLGAVRANEGVWYRHRWISRFVKG